jgi:GNAT superfamily N-acetyltransferase
MPAKNKSEKIVIREYRDSDFDVCLSLWKELAQYHVELYECPELMGPDPGHGFKEYIVNPARKGTWVAEIDGKVVGFSGLLIESPAHSDLEPMIVSEKYRNRGVSAALMKKVVAEAKKSGVWFLSVQPGARNKTAFDTYVKLGFRNIWTVQLIQELNPPGRPIKWLPGIKIHDNELGC